MEGNRSNKRFEFTPLEVVNRATSSHGRLILLAGIVGALLVVVIIAVVLAVVIPKQISSLEYYEYGLKREKSTGVVLLDKVYTGGKYWLGGDYDFLVYKASVHHLYLQNISTFTKERLQVRWNLRLQYFIRRDELIDLHKTFGTNFSDSIKAIATDELKVTTTMFGIRDGIQIERQLNMALRQRIGGICCRPNCNQTDYELACFSGCKLTDFCMDNDKGLHVDIKHIQLVMAQMPDAVQARFVAAITLLEQSYREKFLQEATVIRKQTEAMVRRISMETEEIQANATHQADTTRKYAESQYISSIEQAVITEFQNSIRQSNITEEERTAGFVYLQTLIDQGQFRPNITFVYGRNSD